MIYTPLKREIDRRLRLSAEWQQWACSYIEPAIKKKYRRKVINDLICEQKYFAGYDFYSYSRPDLQDRDPGFFKAICIVIGWCK